MGASRILGLAADILLMPLALLAIFFEAYLLPVARRAAACTRWAGTLARVQRQLARLPPGLALLLFLIPELCSRAGWLLSAWLLLHGHIRRAMWCYGLTKLLAGSVALLVYVACEPALLRIVWFARFHARAHKWRRALLCGGRFAAVQRRLRSRGLPVRTPLDGGH